MNDWVNEEGYRRHVKETEENAFFWRDECRKAEAESSRRLELLKRCNETMPTCPVCKGSLRKWHRLAYNEVKIVGHTEDCKLAKEIA